MQSPVRIVIATTEPLAAGRWRVTFRVTNLLETTLVLDDGWVPHGRFRGEGHVALDVRLPPKGETELALTVSADEPVGTVVENAFLILRVRSQAEGWRVFTRMRITFEAQGMRPIVEAITAHTLVDDAAVT